MAISGPQAIRSLDNAIRDIRVEESRIAKLLSRSTERTAKLNETKASLIKQLANIYLDKNISKQLSSDLSIAQNQAHKVLEKHDVNLNRFEKSLKKLDAQIAQNAVLRRQELNKIDDAQNELKTLSEKIKKQISSDETYSKLQKKLHELEKIAKESMDKTLLSEKDKEQKGAPYRNDILFMYLWNKKFGTTNYKASLLTRFFDKKIAALVRYHDARPNFSMLNEIPIRLREHANYQASLVLKAEEEIDTLEIQAIDKAGGKPFRQKLIKAQEDLVKIDEKMLELEDERDEETQNYRALAQGREPAFEKASQILTQSLEHQDILALIRMANNTTTNEDNNIVNQLEDINTLILDEKPESKQLKSRLKTLTNRRRELEDIEYEFKKSRFDDPRSIFKKDSLTGSLLSEFLAGAISGAVYWRQWQNNQSWRAGSSDWGGGIGLPRSGRRSRGASPWGSSKTGSSPWGNSSRSSSGSFSRPRRSSSRSGSRGSRTGGGFKTGGGF